MSLDATGVGIQGPNAAAAEGRMVDVGLIFDPGNDGRPGRMRALAGLYALGELGPQMRRQAEQVGLDAAEVWVGLTDGGSGLDEFLRVYFPRAELVLDFYHAAGHLNDLAQALHPTDAEAAGELAGRWCHQLKHAGGAAVLATLEAVDLRGRKADVRERHRLVTGYVRSNRFRMDYPRYRANGWLIGSGHVESACKGVVGLRLKGAACAGASPGRTPSATCGPCSRARRGSGTPSGPSPRRPDPRKSHQLKRRSPQRHRGTEKTRRQI